MGADNGIAETTQPTRIKVTIICDSFPLCVIASGYGANSTGLAIGVNTLLKII